MILLRKILNEEYKDLINHFPFALAPRVAGEDSPRWNGNAFSIGNTISKVLQYSSNYSGWSDDLTLMQEDTAGSQHFINRASRTQALIEIKKNLTKVDPVILEIGCSSGFMINDLISSFPQANIIGADVTYSSLLKLADKLPSTPLLQFDLVHCPLPDNCLDVVVLLNVLEHIQDDAAALRQIHRLLKPGGIAVLEVPAGPHLYDVYDKFLLHYRRYRLKELTDKIKQETHFDIVKQSHLGFFLYPAFQMVKKRNQRFLHASEEKQSEIVKNNIVSTGKSGHFLNLAMAVELSLGKYVSYPFGIRCLVTCVKKDK